MSNARSISTLAGLAAHLTNLIGLSGSKATIDSVSGLSPHVANLIGLSNSKSAIDTAVAAPAASLPAGTVLDFAGPEANVPTGFIVCDGRVLSTTAYSALFASIGNAHNIGGEAAGTFRIPDARGRVSAGKDNMGGTAAGRLTNTGVGTAGLDGTALGASGGADRHALTKNQLPAHNHEPITMGGGNGTTGVYLSGFASTPYTPAAYSPSLLSNVGNNEAHPNVQPTIVFNKIIKT